MNSYTSVKADFYWIKIESKKGCHRSSRPDLFCGKAFANFRESADGVVFQSSCKATTSNSTKTLFTVFNCELDQIFRYPERIQTKS